MRSKRLLSLILAVCLVFSVISPAAAATVQTGNDAVTKVPSQNADNAATEPSGEVVSSDEANGLRTLRDDQDGLVKEDEAEFGIINTEGQWTATETDMPVSVLDMDLPECVRELRELAKTHSAAEVVSAFVVLEKAPLVETYSSINDVPASAEATLEAQQNAVISLIEENVLNGEELTVVSQFTYLTNAIVVETEFSNLESIAYLEGVETVFITPVFYPCTTLDPQTVTSGQMSGVSTVWDTESLGYAGEGMTIAILDTGLDLDHPSFAADPEDASWSAEDVAAMLADLDLNAEELYSGTLDADDLYYNAKVPFAFNYAMGTTNVGHDDGVGDHGTHVAGIAAANKVEGTGVVGMAPNAQIIVMKVFNSETGGANMYDILNALEDCMKLGVDVANMSLGSPAGFSSSGIEVIDDVFAAIATTDLIVDVAAGNEGTSTYGSLWGNGLHTTEDIDNATISSPSTYANVMSIASVDNAYVMTNFFALADGTKVFFQPSVEYLYEYTTDGLVEVLAGQDLEYVIVPNLGAAEDFLDEAGNSIVDGKVAVVKRGESSFADKAANAENAGAVAVLIWDNVAEDIFSFGMTTSTQDDEGNIIAMPGIPVALISLDDGQLLADAETKTLTVSAEADLRVDNAGGQVSSFSCWGVGTDLSLLPDFAGVGGNIYSCYDDGEYGLMSGTSMATPQVAGITALVLQYIEEKFPNISIAEKRTLVDALLMSTAVPVIDQDTNLEASPRQQGAGLVNALAAVTTGAYLSVEGSDRPKAELGASADGTYSFTFTVHNFSDVDQSYEGTASLLCEDYMEDPDFPGKYFLAGEEHKLDESAMVCYAHIDGTLHEMSSLSGVIKAGESMTFTVEIKLTDADKEWIDTYFPSGNYVEGFIKLEGTADHTVDLSLPFLGFYGDWAEARIFDTGFWYQNGFWADMVEGIEPNGVEANEYYHVPWVSTGYSSQDWVLGLNIYANDLPIENGSLVYDSKNNVVSPNGDGAMDQITDYYLSLLRNAKWMKLTYTDAQGNVLHTEELDYISKTMYNSNYGGTVPFVYSWYYDGLYDFTDANGEYLADGTALTLTISAALDYADEEFTDEIVIPVYVDTVAPEMVGEPVASSTEEGNFLTVTFTDAHPAFAAVMNKSGTQVYVEMDDTDFVANEDGTFSVTLDVTDLGNSFVVALCDYGANEAFYDLVWTEGDNNPEVSEDTLYAYQVYDEVINAYYGWDYMFGWAELDKTTAEAALVSSDAAEYYAIVAADYAGGYVFAVDAGYNLVYMIPGLWSRNQICNLGVNVLDMAFDEVTQTMYLTTKTETEYGNVCALYTVDLLTGELTLVHEYDSQYDMPWAMTFVDGDLYCCKYYYSGFFQVDLEGETYELVNVTDAEGNNFMPKNMGGSNVSPRYAQSMTYSAKDGVIYWAYYNGSACELLAIDPETWTNTAVAMQWDQEFVGLLTVEDDGYTLPESTEVTDLVLADESVILAVGEDYQMTASTLPWNAPAVTLSWETSNGSVATVNEDGEVTAVAEGSAVITVSYGELSDSCTVNVVDIDSSFTAYNYYSGLGEGNWIDVDLSTMAIESLEESPVDFIAADYNGHNGLTYGFDEFGQFYRYDRKTGECKALGAPNNMIVADMAYDYSTGLMYAIVYDYNSFTTTLYNVNLNSGAMVEAAVAYDVIYMTLACDMYGVLYGITVFGELHMLFITEGGGMGGGIMPWSTDGETSKMVEAVPVMQTPVAELAYIQSMCYDHENDVLLWTNPETASIYWINFLADEPYLVNLGDPTETGIIEYVGMHTVPAEIPELPFTPVASLEGEDMMVLVDGAKAPAVSVYPLNATNGTVTFTSDNEAVAKVEDGMIVGVSAGSATITATLVDTDPETSAETTHTCTFQVAVKNSTDNIYGYLVTDVATYNGYTWIGIQDTDPNNYSQVAYVSYNDAYLTLYSAEYVDGLIYAYGFDDSDWTANFHFLTIDPKTWSVIDGKDMGDEFPFVYDLAFDYTTGTMYAVAGTQTASDIYMVNMNNGELIECVLTEPMFMSLAIDENGTIYAMAKSEETFDPMTWQTSYSNAMLYTVDVENGTYELFLDTGVCNNMICSMAYDFDTGYIYWSNFAQTTGYISGLYLIDPADKSCNSLGTIGVGGAQVTGLMVLADEYPELPDTLQGLALTVNVAELAVGDTYTMETFQQPANLDVELTWTTADESIATVDENGVVTGVAAGNTTVTVSAASGDETISATASVVVYGLDDYFLTYNRTDAGFASIGRPDTTKVENLTEGEELPEVSAMEIGPNGVLYAYDVEGNLFKTCELNGFERTVIGNAGVEVREPETETEGYATYEYEYFFTIADMAWDEANQRMLAVAYEGRNVHYVYNSPNYSYEDDSVEELSASCKIYTVDLETGALTELCTVGGENYESSVYMLAVTDTGAVYVYSAYADYVMSVDLETGNTTEHSTLQNMGVYGSSDGDPMAMTYDAATNSIYMLFTQNGNLYSIYKYNVATTALSSVGVIGEEMDAFAGLTLNEKHEHDFKKDAEWTGDGCYLNVCDCGAEQIVDCTDKNNDHKCDVCGDVLSECVDENEDYKCDICGAELEKPVADSVIRLAGAHRWATSLMVADEMKANLGVEKFGSIIIASGNDFADALAGSYLSTVKSAPILLSWGKGGNFEYLDTDNIEYIKANLAEGGTVYILGGTNAVPELYEEALKGYTVKRLGGADRFETNLLILAEAGVEEGSEILVCTSTNFADSLSASATGKPILLVFNELGKLYGAQPEYLAKLQNCTFTVIGGESAVSADLAKAIEAYGATIRLAGTNRFETSVLVAEKYFENPETAVLAYAWNYPDGLCGGSLAFSLKAPLVLTMTKYEAQAVEYATGNSITTGIVLGGDGLISDDAVRAVFAMDAADEIIVK